MARTVFLGVHQGFAARYLLRTDILRVLRDSGHRLVILSPSSAEEYFRAELRAPNVHLEPFRIRECEQYYARSRLQHFAKAVRSYTAPGAQDVSWTRYWHSHYVRGRPRDSAVQNGYNAAFDAAAWLLKKSAAARRWFIAAESALFPGALHADLFEKYRPDLLVTTSLGNLGFDHYLMREARRRGVKTLAAILSWDNPTTKGLAGAFVDRAVTWTETMKRELVKGHDIDPSRVFVGGVPIYDMYFRPGALMCREELLQRFGLAGNRKLLFMALMSPTQFPWNAQLVRTLAEAVKRDAFGPPCQLLVRIHPIYFRVDRGTMKHRDEAAQLLELEKEFEHLRFDTPEILSEKMSFDMPATEMVKVGSILKASDCVLSFFSSMMIEACIFDTPVVNVAVYPRNLIPTEELVKYDHIHRVLETGGVRTAWTEDELLQMVRTYLQNPQHDRREREAVADNEAGPNRGSAGRAIGKCVLQALEE